MARRTKAITITGFLVSLAIMVPAAEPRSKADNNGAAQLKTLRDERVKVLTHVVDMLTAQYKIGFIGSAQLASAETDLCNALLDSTEESATRVALLTKQLDRVSAFLKTTQGRRQSGQIDVVDVYRAEAVYLDIKIRLLQERSKANPPIPASAGQPTRGPAEE